ncbi:MAG: pitrilysin family protein [Chloroflexi bacterium]|nr:pitrilysin family protein [Chloroflexota bacterium]
MFQKTVLDNGLRVVTSSMPHTRSVCIGVFVGTGSRYESDAEAGVSHFIEHLCFKGTKKRVAAKDISEAIERVGGILNGGTDKELTMYWCKVARPHFSLAVDVLADMLADSRFDLADIEKERQIIIEEINMSLDSPQQRVDMLIDELVWPEHPLGRDIAGTKATVSSLSRSGMLSYLSRHYLGNNTVVTVAGDIGHDEALITLKDAFGSWRLGPPQTYLSANGTQSRPQCRCEYRDTEQANLCLSLPGLSLSHPARFALDLFNIILGEGMSSRLFEEIREKRGLAYSIQSYLSHHLDTGCLTVCAGVDPRQLATTVKAVLEEINRLTYDVPELDLTKAKEMSKGRLLLRMEDTRSVAGWLGGQELLQQGVLTVEQVVSIVDSIQASDLLSVAQQVLTMDKLNLAVVGPVKEDELNQALAA